MKIRKKIIKLLMPTNKLWRGLKNTSYLTIGHFITMVINFFGFIFIARLLGPGEYGVYLTVGAFVGLFLILTLSGMNKVVLREGAKNFEQMGDYFNRTLGLKILFTFIAIIICIICSFFMPYTLQEKFYIIVFSFSLIYRSFEGYFATIYQAAEKMQYISALNILNRILFVPLSIALLYLGFGLPGLFGISLFSQFLTLIINYKLAKRFLSFKFLSKINFDKTLLKSALIFSILSFSVLLTTKIDIVMVSWLSTSEDVGIYGVGHQITQIGSEVRNLMAIAFFPIFVKIFHKSIVKWRKLLKYAFLLGFGILLLAFVGSYFSEDVITLLFGVAYSESGIILSVLIFFLAASFFTIPFTNSLQATHNESKILAIFWIGPCVNIGLNYLLFKIYGLIGIAYSTLFVGVFTIFSYSILTWIVLKKQKRIY